MTAIIHLTDMHFGAGKHNRINIADVKKALIKLISELDTPPVFVVSGDITYKAQESGYKAATAFFEEIIAGAQINPNRFVFCPGNHDIQDPEPFKRFNAFCYSIRKDSLFDFTKNNTIAYCVDDLYFIVTNSSHHRDKTYGLVHSEDLQNTLKQNIPENIKHRFAIIHHHLIPISQGDVSVTRNAYEYLTLLDENEISAILHGHQHFNVAFPVGKSHMTIHGAGSFGYAENGIVNGLNVYYAEGPRLTYERYALLIDQPVASKTGFTRVGERQIIR